MKKKTKKNGKTMRSLTGISVLLIIYTDWKKNQTIENVRQL